MPREETKSQKILRLSARGDFTDREIAEAVGTSQSYVRTVARQRRGHKSEADRRYLESDLGRLQKKRRDMKAAPAKVARFAAVRAGGDKKAANAAARNAYAAVRNAGGSVEDAVRAKSRAWSRVMYHTGDKDAGNTAYRAALKTLRETAHA